MQITTDTHVADLATTFPGTIRVFQHYGLDFCCGGKRPLGDVCRQHGLNVDELIKVLTDSLSEIRDDVDWSTRPLSDLTAHILHRFHQPLRGELPRLRAMLDKVISRHGDTFGTVLEPLSRTFDDFHAELLSHMQKEEVILFPAIDARDRGDHDLPLPCGTIAAPVAVMEMEHEHAGEALATMRRLTDGFTPPEWACPTFRGLYHGLAELEREMHLHVHLENNVLFPRALAAQQG